MQTIGGGMYDPGTQMAKCESMPRQPTISERIEVEINALTKRLSDLRKVQELLAKSEIKEIVDLLSTLNIHY